MDPKVAVARKMLEIARKGLRDEGLCGTCVEGAVRWLVSVGGPFAALAAVAHPVEGSGVEGAGGEPPRRRFVPPGRRAGQNFCDRCGAGPFGEQWKAAVCDDCWRAADAALGSRPSVITEPANPAKGRSK